MICGPKGVGKTTVMLKVLHGEPGVMHISYDPCTVDNFYTSLLSGVCYKYEQVDKASLVIKALRQIKDKGGRKPTFLVDLNEKCDTEQPMHLLVVMKI